jgi:hypothetical protein
MMMMMMNDDYWDIYFEQQRFWLVPDSNFGQNIGHTKVASRYSSVGRVTRLWSGQTGVDSRQKEDTFLFSKAQSCSEAHISSSYSVGREAVSSAVKWPVREVCHSSPPTAEIRNECNYTSTPSICLHGVDTGEMTFVWRPANSGTALQVCIKPLLKHPSCSFYIFHSTVRCYELCDAASSPNKS